MPIDVDKTFFHKALDAANVAINARLDEISPVGPKAGTPLEKSIDAFRSQLGRCVTEVRRTISNALPMQTQDYAVSTRKLCALVDEEKQRLLHLAESDSMLNDIRDYVAKVIEREIARASVHIREKQAEHEAIPVPQIFIDAIMKVHQGVSQNEAKKMAHALQEKVEMLAKTRKIELSLDNKELITLASGIRRIDQGMDGDIPDLYQRYRDFILANSPGGYRPHRARPLSLDDFRGARSTRGDTVIVYFRVLEERGIKSGSRIIVDGKMYTVGSIDNQCRIQCVGKKGGKNPMNIRLATEDEIRASAKKKGSGDKTNKRNGDGGGRKRVRPVSIGAEIGDDLDEE